MILPSRVSRLVCIRVAWLPLRHEHKDRCFGLSCAQPLYLCAASTSITNAGCFDMTR